METEKEAKKILIIRAGDMGLEGQECDMIMSQSILYGMDVQNFIPKDNNELLQFFDGNSVQYDYIYLSAHGNDIGFSSENRTISCSWIEFGEKLCASECMKEDCIIMLSCCRGGLNQVAYDLFYSCPNISYIIGPRQSLPVDKMLLSFNIFLYSLERRKIDPIVACEKIKHATDIRFVCFDRLEIEAELGYKMHSLHLDNKLNKRGAISMIKNFFKKNSNL